MKVLVAMSGGVDSTVAAHLLKQAGNEVIGVNFNFLKKNKRDGHCMGEFHEPQLSCRGEHCEPARMGEFHEPQLSCRGEHCEPELEEIASKLKIKIIYRDYASEFHDKIIKYFVSEYEHGRTPNPCALCNPTMKFAKLIEVMKEEGCDMIATGHYANVTTIPSQDAFVSTSTESHQPIRYCIKKSSNQQKDQSYMLYRLTQEQLSHIIFPLGNMDKNDVRKIASELGLSVANKKDSQDVCFIEASPEAIVEAKFTSPQTPVGAKFTSPQTPVGAKFTSPQTPVGASTASPLDYKEFIKRYEFGPDYREKIALGLLKEEEILSKRYFKKGEFVDLAGNVLGYHNGIINYTIGQRKGLNIAFGERKFVVRIDIEKNQVVLGSNDDLFSKDFKIKDVVFSGHDENIIGKKFYAKLRYRHDGTLCENKRDGDNYSCHLDEPVRAITPGQSAVFYDDEGRVMFGGIIV